MTPELKAALKWHTQLFGSYTKAGNLVKVRVWLTLNQGKIEFLTSGQSLKTKRVARNPRVVCFVGQQSVPGTAEIVKDKNAVWRTYRAYWKTAAGSWVNGQYFLRTLYLSQYHRAIGNLENRDDWKARLKELGLRIKHSPFKDDHGFLSYKVSKVGEAGLF